MGFRRKAVVVKLLELVRHGAFRAHGRSNEKRWPRFLETRRFSKEATEPVALQITSSRLSRSKGEKEYSYGFRLIE
jgi:hypothetical protein